MVIFIILFITSILLELILPNLFKDIFPIFSIGIILLGTNIKDKTFYTMLLLLGILSSFLFSSSIILYSNMFMLIGFIAKLIINKKTSFINYTFSYILISYIYLLILFIYTYFYNNITILKLTRCFISNLLINLGYFVLSYIVYFVITRKNKHIGKIGDISDYKR